MDKYNAAIFVTYSEWLHPDTPFLHDCQSIKRARQRTHCLKVIINQMMLPLIAEVLLCIDQNYLASDSRIPS